MKQISVTSSSLMGISRVPTITRSVQSVLWMSMSSDLQPHSGLRPALKLGLGVVDPG